MNYYEKGYEDGKSGKPLNLSLKNHAGWEDYRLGHADGLGERKLTGRAVDETYADWVDPPKGFRYTGEKRTPRKGEYYLTKNGNAKLAPKERGNNQTRHILERV